MLFLQLNPDAGGARFVDLPGIPTSFSENLAVTLPGDLSYTPTVRNYTYRSAQIAFPEGRPYSDERVDGEVPRRTVRVLLSDDFPIEAFENVPLANTILTAAGKYPGGDVALAAVRDAEFPLA